MEDLVKFTKVLPLELKDLFGKDLDSREEMLQNLLHDGGQWMLQQISHSGDNVEPDNDQPDSMA